MHSQSDDVVRWVARKGTVEVGKAADLNAVDRPAHSTLTGLASPMAGRVAPTRLSFGEVSFERAHVAHHEQDSLIGSHLRKTRSHRIVVPQDVVVVIEEEDTHDLDAMGAKPRVAEGSSVPTCGWLPGGWRVCMRPSLFLSLPTFKECFLSGTI